MSGAGHFPTAIHVGIGLLGAAVTQSVTNHVGFGDEIKHRSREIGANTHHRRRRYIARIDRIDTVRRTVDVRRA